MYLRIAWREEPPRSYKNQWLNDVKYVDFKNNVREILTKTSYLILKIVQGKKTNCARKKIAHLEGSDCSLDHLRVLGVRRWLLGLGSLLLWRLLDGSCCGVRHFSIVLLLNVAKLQCKNSDELCSTVPVNINRARTSEATCAKVELCASLLHNCAPNLCS